MNTKLFKPIVAALVVILCVAFLLVSQVPSILPIIPTPIAEMYQYESAGVQTIDTTDVYHFALLYSAGDLEGWTFNAGSTGPIASFEDYSGTVAGTIKAVDVAHGLITGDDISITGTSAPNDYNGIYTLTKIDDDSFYFTNAGWNATTTATWVEGSYLEAGAAVAGCYLINFSITAASAAAAKNFKFELFKNSSELNKTATEMTPAGTNHQSCGSNGLVTILPGDRIYVALKNETDANDLNLEHSNVILHKI